MDLGPGWVHRDELLAAVRQEGHPTSSHQLLRWHNAGLLPQPRRVGRGRALGGSDSYYPWWAIPQAAELASQLKRKRSLDDAGWVLWVVGFPVADFARDLLLDQLERQEDVSRRVLTRRPGRASELERAVRTPQATKLWKWLYPKQRETVLRMAAEWQLGTLRPDHYSEMEWEDFQAATVAIIDPDLITNPGLPSSQEVRVGMGALSNHRSLPKVIRALKRINEFWFRIYTNEAQALFTMMVRSLTDLPVAIPRDAFLEFFAALYVDGPTKDKIRDVRRAFGLTTPPLSPLQQMVARHRAVAPTDQGGKS